MQEFSGMNLFGSGSGDGNDDDDTALPEESNIEVELDGNDDFTSENDSERLTPETDLGDNDLGDFTGKFRKRLERESRVKKLAQARAEEAETRLRQIESELETERQARLQLSQQTATAELSSIDADIEKTRAEYKQIRNDYEADPDREIELQEKLADLRQRKRELETYAETRTRQVPAQTQQPVSQAQIKATQEWLQRNSWFDKPEYRVQTAAARVVDADLAAEGYKPDSANYFNELDLRLKKAGIRLPTGQRNNNHDPVQSSSTVTTGKGNVVSISEEEQRFMRSMNLDPTNPVVVKKWAQEKRKLGA